MNTPVGYLVNREEWRLYPSQCLNRGNESGKLLPCINDKLVVPHGDPAGRVVEMSCSGQYRQASIIQSSGVGISDVMALIFGTNSGPHVRARFPNGTPRI